MTEPLTNHHHASFRSQRGFTFIEVIIAVVMVAFVGGVLLSILSGSRRSTTETRAQVARQVTLRSINEVIEIDLEKVSFSATAPAGAIPSAPNGTGAVLRLIDGRSVTYYLDDNVVYRAENPSGAERPVASDIEALEFSADNSARTITVRAAPLAPGSGGAGAPNAFAVEMTRLVRNP